ncbi:acyl CoA:acetate/3-ketoacid CoA transferase [Pseudomonas sp. R5(2019)]|uniref:acyl CoA:acetate/3-ketoacid CoA transferase n=1 Tax=Pseudomonas sp. R5(2019) TaxID=2697566 RepID=UPI001412A836|nr:CoA-transferase [Pseudomonas sp. R5(2019)]NBA94807.1 acyl CoA:acetate/3-ketoacid CoA transferase [Pseudomonas sp. R5(2019)]
MKRRCSSASDVVSLIADGATLAVCGSGTLLEPDALLFAIEESFLRTGHPRDLTIVHALGIGDGQGSGLERLAHKGLVRKVIGGHWSWSAKMQKLAKDNEIAAYSIPAGAIMSLMREIGAGRPGLITHIGLGTFADPNVSGGRCNELATESIVERLEIDGKPYLRYKPFKVDVALVRGSLADPSGNITLAHEAADLDVYALALAAHNSGGKVFVQVRELSETPFVPARMVRIPGVLVDDVVLAPEQRQCLASDYDPEISGECLPRPERPDSPLPEDIRRIIAQRAADEFTPGMSLNFGFGIPAGIPSLLAERGLQDQYWGSIEQGIHNGRMMDGAMFGAARFPQAIVTSLDQFDFYSGGGVDLAFLGMGEMDQFGNVNVSSLGGRLVGPGGFVDITQGARKVVFCGAFEAKGLQVERHGSELAIVRPGEVPKLVEQVSHITFSGPQALVSGKEVLYVTERAVFRLVEGGIELVEVAQGVDPQRDVLDRMSFKPLVRDPRFVALK